MSEHSPDIKAHDDWYDCWVATMSEDKLELIDGKLIINTALQLLVMAPTCAAKLLFHLYFYEPG